MIKNYLLFIFLLMSFSIFGQKKYYLLVGTYNSAKSNGIYVYDFNIKDGLAEIVDSVATSNPSYLEISPDQKFVYAVNEDGANGNGGRVTSFSFDRTMGHPSQLSTTTSMGDHPCYVSVDQTGKWVMAGNYTSGSASLFYVDELGWLQKKVSI